MALAIIEVTPGVFMWSGLFLSFQRPASIIFRVIWLPMGLAFYLSSPSNVEIKPFVIRRLRILAMRVGIMRCSDQMLYGLPATVALL